jgi:hypothetical protein
VGVESKRYEPFRGKSQPAFSEAFDRPVWDGLNGFNALRTELCAGRVSFKRLDAAQLIKHALGLSAEARRKGAKATLFYLFAEPKLWPDGALVDVRALDTHRQDIAAFAQAVAGDIVAFKAAPYRELLEAWSRGSDRLSDHARRMLNSFDL